MPYPLDLKQAPKKHILLFWCSLGFIFERAGNHNSRWHIWGEYPDPKMISLSCPISLGRVTEYISCLEDKAIESWSFRLMWIGIVCQHKSYHFGKSQENGIIQQHALRNLKCHPRYLCLSRLPLGLCLPMFISICSYFLLFFSPLPTPSLQSFSVFKMKLESKGSQKKIHGSISSKYTQISI